MGHSASIPEYIISWLIPNEYTLEHLPVALAHETNHNIRFQFIEWKNDITLGEMMISEGLAENFAIFLYGEDKAGPWVTKTDMITLNEYIKPIIQDGLNVQGFENLNAYLYGDERFKNSIDKAGGDGTADFVKQAIVVYCRKKQV